MRDWTRISSARGPSALVGAWGVVIGCTAVAMGCSADLGAAGPVASTGAGGSGSGGGSLGTGGSVTAGGGGFGRDERDATAADQMVDARPDVGDAANDVPSESDGGGLADAIPSSGCGKQPNQPLQTYIAKQTIAGTMNRTYRVWLPQGYDPERPYRAVYLGHGCGGNNGTPFPGLEKVVDAVLIALVAVGPCFDNGNGTNSSPELVYFDQVAKEVSSNFCIDQARVFIAGFSSGSWLSHLIGCARAGSGPGKVRGQVTATGEWPNPPPCTGPVASMLAHDMADTDNPFAAGMIARDHILQTNRCGTQTVPYSWDGVAPATATSGGCAVATPGCQPCVEYQGCTPGYPMIWCPTKGSNPIHNNQVPLTTVGLWHFVTQF